MVKRAGVVPIHNNKLILVTSKKHSYYVLPGGKINENESSKEAARREAFEEAGVLGKIKDDPIYNDENLIFYEMEVEELVDDYPEIERERIFVDVNRIDLAKIISIHINVVQAWLKLNQ